MHFSKNIEHILKQMRTVFLDYFLNDTYDETLAEILNMMFAAESSSNYNLSPEHRYSNYKPDNTTEVKIFLIVG